jgi:hypothetical protein
MVKPTEKKKKAKIIRAAFATVIMIVFAGS